MNQAPMAALAADFLLDPGVDFLNHGSFGACPSPVFRVYQDWQRELEREPVRFLSRQLPGLLTEARTTLGEFLDWPGDGLVFVPNTTTGVNIVARSLALGPGDAVLTTDHEYGACDRVWRFVATKTGFEYRQARVPLPVSSGEEVLDALAQAWTPDVRVVFASHITSASGLIFPAEAICRWARTKGAIAVIDGAHAPGQIPLSLTDVGADVYIGNCHKWLCAPKGSAFLAATEAARGWLEPLIVSWGWDSPTVHSEFIDQLQFTGTRDPAAYLAVPAAIGYQADHDWPAVRKACHRMVRDARDRLLGVDGVTPVAQGGDRLLGQMAAVVIPDCDPIRLVAHLYEAHQIEVASVAWNGRTVLRVSAQAYNRPEQYERLASVLPGALVNALPS